MLAHSLCFQVWALEPGEDLLQGTEQFLAAGILRSSSEGTECCVEQPGRLEWSSQCSSCRIARGEDPAALAVGGCRWHREEPCSVSSAGELLCSCCDAGNGTAFRYCLKWYCWVAGPWRWRENQCVRGKNASKQVFFGGQPMPHVTWNVLIIT